MAPLIAAHRPTLVARANANVAPNTSLVRAPAAGRIKLGSLIPNLLSWDRRSRRRKSQALATGNPGSRSYASPPRNDALSIGRRRRHFRQARDGWRKG